MMACFVLILSYLLGAMPFGYWLVRLKLGEDIRNLGSGNIGATNVSRVLGKRWGRVVLGLDILKGFISVLIAGRVSQGEQIIVISSAVLSVLGHIFPIYIGFRGGKGVATGIGVLLGMSIFFPKLFLVLLIGLITWLVVYRLFGFVSLASILMAFSIVLSSLLLITEIGIRIFSITIGLLVIYRHRSNVIKLLKGEEKKTEL